MRRVRFVTDPGELVDVTLKPNYRRLGPRFGKRMPEVAEAVAGARAGRDRARPRRRRDGHDRVDGAAERLEADDLLREARPTEGYAVGQDAAPGGGPGDRDHPRPAPARALAREIVHAVQWRAAARPACGWRSASVLHLDGSGLIREAAEGHRDEIAAETLATAITVSHGAPFAGHPPRGARHRRASPSPSGSTGQGREAAPPAALLARAVVAGGLAGQGVGDGQGLLPAASRPDEAPALR